MIKENKHVQLRLFMMSDNHIGRYEDDEAVLAKCLVNMKEKDPTALYLNCGDITANGLKEEFETFYRVLRQVYPDPESSIVILGNHDVRGEVQDWSNNPQDDPVYFETVKPLYVTLNQLSGQSEDQLSIDRWVNGVHLIALNTEKGLKDSVYLSEALVRWLETTLAESQSEEPVFVLNHQALNDTHWRSNSIGGFGEQDVAVKAILEKYPHVIFISGHIHNGFGVIETHYKAYGTQIELPSLTQTENGLVAKGMGYYVTIFDNGEVLFEAWDFYTNQALREFDVHLTSQRLPIAYLKLKKALDSKPQGTFTGEGQALLAQVEQVFERQYDQALFEQPGSYLEVKPPADYGQQQVVGKEQLAEIAHLEGKIQTILERLND